MRVLSCSLVIAVLAAPVASAQQRQAQPQAQPAQPARPGADEYTTRVRAGIDQLAGGDTNGALSTFREALAMNGARPEAQYYIGEASRVSGNLAQAVSAFQQAAALALSANEPRWQGRALHGVASTLERMEGRIEDARTAWQEYVRFADSHTNVSDPGVGRARIQAIDMMNEQEQVYVQVRQRIAEREQERAREEREGAQRRRQPR
jgi:tetratricopeptide (TPR) repeat protein